MAKIGRPPTPVEQRFWAKVVKTEGGCWLWVGTLDSKGYGTLGVPGGGTRHVPKSAHRISWEVHNGPIPDGLGVLHDCPGGDNPLCVNPAHLWLGTQKDNNLDRCVKGRTAFGERQGQAKLTSGQVLAIREERRLLGTSYRELAGKYGVDLSAIWSVVKRKTWKHI